MDKSAIFAAADIRKPEILPVQVPEYGQVWYVRELFSSDDSAFVQKLDLMSAAGKGNAWFACNVVCDASGKRMFDDGDVDMIAAKIPTRILRRVWAIGGKLNGMRNSDGDVLEKNSEPTQSDASS